MIKSDYKPHIIALTSQFVMGNSVLMFSQSSNIFFTIIISLGFSVAFLLVLNIIIKRSANHLAFNFVTAFISALALFGVVSSLYDYFRFLSDVQLTKTNVFLTTIPLIVVLVVFTACSNSALYKYCLLTAVINIGVIVIVFIGGIKAFDISQTKAFFHFSLRNFTDGFKFFLRYFSSLAAVGLFVFTTKKDTSQKTILLGTVLGFLAITICIIQSFFTLGISASVEYPYIKAAGVISSGSLYTRLDGLVYWLFFSLTLIKSTLCLKVVWLTIKHMYHKKQFFHQSIKPC